ncbi:hypothetical protein A2U01_0066791 [Trifolium medium]|jgi:hypothetical protein|uniref:Uncharacterized protein n=2 Tax=Trifolium TaxID=3898 RepID=A0A2K3NZN8_TRIPR|nr:hypothetical protein [Trifolium medium]PNY08500.1 hypothetical protein L195_g005026 [Trifolium pratense]
MNNLKKAMPNPREEEDYEEGSRCLGRGWCLILCLKPKLELELKPNYKFHLKLKLGLEPELVLMS